MLPANAIMGHYALEHYPMSDFPDYYETLQISPNAQPETIHRVYRMLATYYHPDNKETGDTDRFQMVLDAYRVLSNPEARAAYDVDYQQLQATRWQIFDSASSLQGVEAEKRKRIAILSLLCSKRVSNPSQPGMGVIEMEQLMNVAREHLELSLWYLRESGRIARGDNAKYALTAKGLEFLEEHSEQAASRVKLLQSPTATPAGEAVA